MVKSDDWFPKGVIKLEDAALEVVKDVTNCLVIAGPGAGKTELLAQKLDYLFSTNKWEPLKTLVEHLERQIYL